MFFIFPYADENPRKNFPFFTVALMLISIAAFFNFNFRVDYHNIVKTYGFTPSNFSWFTIVTSMFLHGSFVHLLSNMWFFWIFADNVEDEMGQSFFLAFYFLGGMAAAFMHSFLSTPSIKQLPCIGASVAVSAVMGAYVVIFPKARVKMATLFLFWFKLVKVKAFYYVGTWFLLQYVLSFFPELMSNVSYGAHIGGFVFGLIGGYIFNEYVKPILRKPSTAK